MIRFEAYFLAAFSIVAASIPAQTVPTQTTSSQIVRSGETLTCHLGSNCAEETIDGHRFFVMETDRMLVRVAVEPTAKYNHIAVTVKNLSGHQVHFDPSDFRIEVTEPKFKRLSYIEPAKLKLPKVKEAKATVRMGSSFMGSSVTKAPEGPKFLTDATLAPAEATSGEVYLERAKDKNSGTMSLLLPIAGSIFEFPYEQTK